MKIKAHGRKLLALIMVFALLLSLQTPAVFAATAVSQGFSQTVTLYDPATNAAHTNVTVLDTVSAFVVADEGSIYYLNRVDTVYDIRNDVQIQLGFSAGMNSWSDSAWKRNAMRYMSIINADTGKVVANWLDEDVALGNKNSSGAYQIQYGLAGQYANVEGIRHTIPKEAFEPSTAYYVILGSATSGNNNQKMLFVPVVYLITTSDAGGSGAVNATIGTGDFLSSYLNSVAVEIIKADDDQISRLNFNRLTSVSSGSNVTASYSVGDAIEKSVPGQEICLVPYSGTGLSYSITVVGESGKIIPFNPSAGSGGNSSDFGDLRFTMPGEKVTIEAVFGYVTNFSVIDGAGAPVANAEVTVWDNNRTYRATNNVSYMLPEGSYNYSVSADGYETKTGALAVTGSAEVPITLSPAGADSVSGDGTVGDPYKIASAAGLMWMAEQVNTGDAAFSSAYYVLTNDIDMSGYDYTPIGNTTTNTFTGQFDGLGHTVTKLKIVASSSLQGLFGYISGGEVRNLRIKDVDITSTSGSVGGIAGYMRSGFIENCYVSGTLEGVSSVGGIVGNSNTASKVINCHSSAVINASGNNVGGIAGNNQSGSLVEKCHNSGKITVATTGTANQTGGIVGYNYNTASANASIVRKCYNTGDISGRLYVGGIVGNNNTAVGSTNLGTVENCYNTGSIEGSDSGVGGIVGNHGAAGYPVVKNCYNTGNVKSSANSAGGIVGSGGIAEGVSNCVALNATVEGVNNVNRIIGQGSSTDCYARTDMLVNGSMQAGNESNIAKEGSSVPLVSFDSAVGWPSEFLTDPWYYVAGKYPLLLEMPETVTFNVTPAGATVVVKDSNEQEVAAEGDGTYQLKTGETYSYTVSAAGYETKTGSFTVDGEVEITAALDKTIYTVTFALSPTTAAVVVKDGAGNAVEAETDGAYKLSIGETYNYTVSATGYETKTGSFTVAGEVEITVALDKTTTGNTGGGSGGGSSTYTVAFDSQGGSALASVRSIEPGAKIASPADPMREGYAFGGWYKDKECTVKWDFTNDTVTASVTLYAKWIADGSTPLSATPGNGIFSDATGHWAEEFINDLAGKGLLKGKTDTSFAPNDKITRAEFITILARMSDADLSTGKTTKFSDVPSSAWYSAAVAWGTENGVINGISETSFAPNAYITREQAASMILRYCQNVGKIALPEINEPNAFQDQNSIAEYASEAVSAMQSAGVIAGKPGNLFAPKDNATRAEVCKIVYTILQLDE